MASSINASTTAGVVTTADTSGVLNIQTAGTTALTVGATQLVSIGTASPSASYGLLTVAGPGISITPDTSSKFQIGRYSAGAPYSYIKMGSTSSGFKFTDPTDSFDLMTLSSTGALALYGASTSANGVGITFPATQAASSNANTLDDYEEGSWTPSFTLGAGSATLTSASGSYVKIGKQVTVLFNISFATATAATIDTITGFTFPFANNTQYGVGALRENSNTGFMWQLRGNGNTTTAIIRKYDNTGVLSAGDTFVGTLTYFTD